MNKLLFDLNSYKLNILHDRDSKSFNFNQRYLLFYFFDKNKYLFDFNSSLVAYNNTESFFKLSMDASYYILPNDNNELLLLSQKYTDNIMEFMTIVDKFDSTYNSYNSYMQCIKDGIAMSYKDNIYLMQLELLQYCICSKLIEILKLYNIESINVKYDLNTLISQSIQHTNPLFFILSELKIIL